MMNKHATLYFQYFHSDPFKNGKAKEIGVDIAEQQSQMQKLSNTGSGMTQKKKRGRKPKTPSEQVPEESDADMCQLHLEWVTFQQTILLVFCCTRHG